MRLLPQTVLDKTNETWQTIIEWDLERHIQCFTVVSTSRVQNKLALSTLARKKLSSTDAAKRRMKRCSFPIASIVLAIRQLQIRDCENSILRETRHRGHETNDILSYSAISDSKTYSTTGSEDSFIPRRSAPIRCPFFLARLPRRFFPPSREEETRPESLRIDYAYTGWVVTHLRYYQ